jgi:hypothetical protein
VRAGRLNLSTYQGDDFSHAIEFRQADGETPYDHTDTGFSAQIRRTRGRDSELLATFTIDDDDRAAGRIVLRLTAEETADLPLHAYWDLELDMAGVAVTVLAGAVRVDREVTHG